MTNHSALRRFLEASAFDAADVRLVAAIARAASSVSRMLSAARAEPLPEGELHPLLNVHGKVLHPFEVAASDTFVSELSKEPGCGGLLGKSFGAPLDFRSHGPDRFVCFSALDNPAQLGNGGPMGATFGIVPWCGTAAESALSPGTELLAAGLVLYSAPLTLVLAGPKRADLFEWSDDAEDFVLARAELRCPMRGASYSVDVPRVPKWDASARDWLSRLAAGELLSRRKYELFHSGALVSDAHRALVEGGIFVHPADSEAEAGDLCLIHEANPLAFVFRAASGRATNGTESPLEVRPTSYAESTPFVAGSRDEVESFERRWGTSQALHRRPA
jgi:fructose-1,6-bisphosphatase I